MDPKQFSQRVAAIPVDNPNKDMWEHLDQRLQTLGASNPEVATLRQEIHELRATPSHSAGLCAGAGCQPCQDARVAVAHQTQEGIIQMFEGAAERYGLKPELALLADAVKHHRADDGDWDPHGALIVSEPPTPSGSRDRTIAITR